MTNIEKRYSDLKAVIGSYSSVLVGFSGGVDSSFLVKTAYDVLGDRALAVIGTSMSYPDREEYKAFNLANQIGIPCIKVSTDEISIEEYRLNRGDRCYFCKRELYSRLNNIKDSLNYAEVLDATNLSDISDDRPGMRAISELGIRTPLVDVGLSKTDIRNLSCKLGLSVWDKPSFACLSSRFSVGTIISEDKLLLIDKGEQYLYDLGLRQFRLRYHDDLVRIELLEKDFNILINSDIRNSLVNSLRGLGFRFITMDLLGYRSKDGEL